MGALNDLDPKKWSWLTAHYRPREQIVGCAANLSCAQPRKRIICCTSSAQQWQSRRLLRLMHR